MKLLLLATIALTGCAVPGPCGLLKESERMDCLYDFRTTNPYYDKGRE